MKLVSILKSKNEWKVYLVECSDGTYYTGIAKNVVERVNVHNSGKGAKYTKGRTPVRLIAVSPYMSMDTAIRMERIIKSVKREFKPKAISALWKYEKK